MIRPPMKVLRDSAQIPAQNLISPAPNQFTHRLVKPQDYFYAAPHKGSPPDGTFAAGTRVVLMAHDDGPICWVSDGQGLYVVTAFAGLRKL